MPKGYRVISIPEKMIEEIEKVIKENPELGYQSVAEFTKDAIRRLLAEIRKEKEEKALIGK